MNVQLPAKTVGEEKLVTLDYSKELALGSTLTGTPTITVALLEGPGPANALTLGSALVVSPLVQFEARAGTATARYLVKCLCDASDGQKHEVRVELPVIA